MNLAVRDIRHNLGRFLLTCLGLGLLLAIVLSMLGIYRGLIAESLTLARAPEVDLWVVETNSRGPFAESSRLPGDTREAVARVAGVTEAGAVTYQSVETETAAGKLRLYVIGYEPGRPGGPTRLVDGRPIIQSRYEVVVDRSTGLTVGDRLKLGRREFRVVGVTAGQVSSGGDPVVFITLRDSQKLQFELAPPAARRELARGGGEASSDIVNAIIARIDPDVPVAGVADGVRRWKHLAVLTQEEQETVLSRSVIERARRQIGLFTTLLLIVSTVIIALIIYTLTIDKTKEIATLKLIGAPDRTIVGLILQQALAMGAIGFTFGVAFIVSMKDSFPRRVVVEAPDVLALGAVVFLVCLLASTLGVRLALKVDPATALAG
ncbi:ABC transporter permease [Rhodoplanes sp. TEM]|uniref:ABC transporter permease n=1 Tax=Rhodoplanes tepidamans TaxID=200616 RepID=A0ABT5J8E1_RHOTP|nr:MULTISPECIES: ABC transporter permease [Rhodoplanes]MDC7785894.1 ABC transporter permease [Rhodoplanes tepidamans]MDC7985006.1 ABC transporter permease [Rhodoplanes sp. TEM]MDQ0355488.1 putative ABC transport system permease protein [Rhodoplanes tepidamans]